MSWVATVVDHTDDRATIAPTERSMPPPVMTKVIPIATTPMTEARRRIVSALATLPNRSPAVTSADDESSDEREDEADVPAGGVGQHPGQAERAARWRPGRGARRLPAVGAAVPLVTGRVVDPAVPDVGCSLTRLLLP